jgi:hypothetical protein
MERKLSLEVDKEKVFSFVFSRSDRAIIISWVAETSVSNMVFLRMITIKWRWPPVKWITCFTDR